MNYLTDFFERGWKMLSDLPILATAIAIGTLGTQLFGDSFWAIFGLSFFAIGVDTLTKWWGIVKRYFADRGIVPTTWQKVRAMCYGEAWQPGYLESKYFGRLLEKILTYTLLIALFHGFGKWTPTFRLMGLVLVPSEVFPAAISICILLLELSSINENLIGMGLNSIADMVARLVGLVTERVLPKDGGRGR